MEKREKRRIKKEIHINIKKGHSYDDDCVCSKCRNKFNEVLFDLLKGEGMKDFGDVDDELSLEDINDELGDESELDKAISKCYGVIEWFDNNTRFEIIAELIHRFKLDEDKQIPKCKK